VPHSAASVLGFPSVTRKSTIFDNAAEDTAPH
jgi:hypothetical protein